MLGMEFILFLCIKKIRFKCENFQSAWTSAISCSTARKGTVKLSFIGAFGSKMFNRQMSGKHFNLTLRSLAWLKSFPIRGIYFGLDGTVPALRTLAKYVLLIITDNLLGKESPQFFL